MKITQIDHMFSFLEIFPLKESYFFEGNKNVCEWCRNVPIAVAYVRIHEKLKEKGLIPQDEKRTCCYCYHILKHPEQIWEVKRIELRYILSVGGVSGFTHTIWANSPIAKYLNIESMINENHKG